MMAGEYLEIILEAESNQFWPAYCLFTTKYTQKKGQ